MSVHMYEGCAITGKTRSLYDERYSCFERYHEGEGELLCSYLLLLLAPQTHLSYTEVLIVSIINQFRGCRMLANG